nr:hypothetical protein GCM10025732_16160 [Glycomyces mayteni]
MALNEEHRDEWFRILGGYPDDEKPDPEDRLAVETSCSGFLGNMWTRATMPEVQGCRWRSWSSCSSNSTWGAPIRSRPRCSRR